MSFVIRKAAIDDQAEIEKLIDESVRGLSRDDYNERQIELSIITVFGVDTELIQDQTYFVAESDDRRIIGCGGWSKRKTLYGASVYSQSRDSNWLNAETDSAKIRAFLSIPVSLERELARQFWKPVKLKQKHTVLHRPK